MTEPAIKMDTLVRIVRGTSMWPLLRSGLRVGIRPVPPATLRSGDIIAFKTPKQVVLHRVVSVKQTGDQLLIREKGDNRPFTTVIHADQVLGKAVWFSGNGTRTDLDHPRRFNLRVVTGLSRAEGKVFDALRAIWLRLAGNTRTRAAARATRVVRSMLLPAKWLVSPLYFSLYRKEPRGADAACAEALLACIRHTCGGEVSAPPFPGAADWNDAMEAAVGHGVEGLVADNLDLPPGDPRRRNMQILRYRGARQYAATVATLLTAQRALAAKAIPFIALKGPSLASEIYSDPTVRPSADIDLLVRKRDVDAALTALAGETHELHGSETSRAIARRSHFHLVLDPVKPPHTKIELHWDLVDRANLYRIDSDDLFERTRHVSVEGTDCAVPGIEDALIYLCLHAAKHGLFNASGLKSHRAPAWYCGAATGNRLIWFVDLHRHLARHEGAIDWPAVRARSEQWNVLDEVGDTLRVLDLLLPGPRTAAALDALGIPPATTGGHAATGWRERLAGKFMTAGNDLVIRPARLMTMRSFLFPSPASVLRYYRSTSRWMLPILYVRHPFHMARRLFGAG